MIRKYKKPVITISQASSYPENPPFHPSAAYPEYRMTVGKEENNVYAAVRDLFYELGLDAEHYGSEGWNPLGEVVHKGQTVVIKPNLVRDSNTGTGSVWSVITHPSVIRAVIDYVYLALEGTGRIIIAEAPSPHAGFEKIPAVVQIETVLDYYRSARNFNIELLDLRDFKFVYSKETHSLIKEYLSGDPYGYTVFNLADRSSLNVVPGAEKYRDSGNNSEDAAACHTDGRHEYSICNTLLNADVIITIPKMKTHGQVGATLNVKNFIGCVGNRGSMPHYRSGYGSEGGDEFRPLSAGARVKRKTRHILKNLPLMGHSRLVTKICRMSKHEESGYWFGNDTLWRTVSDVFSIIEYGNKDGTISDVPCRKIYGIIDGIIAGDHNGPNANDTRNCGVLISGNNMIASDLAAIRLMGFDFRKLPLYRELTGTIMNFDQWINGVVVKSDAFSHIFSDPENRFFDFREPAGWKGMLTVGNGRNYKGL